MPQQSLVLSYRQAVHKRVLEDGVGNQLVHASTNAADLGDFQTSMHDHLQKQLLH